MVTFHVSNLNNGTTLSDRQSLLTALRAVSGVNAVTVSPALGEVSISFRGNHTPEHDVLSAAMSSAGFMLSHRSDRWTG